MNQFVCDACLAGAPEWMCVCEDDRAAEAALAAAAREGGDVEQAPGEAPQSGGDSRNAQTLSGTHEGNRQ